MTIIYFYSEIHSNVHSPLELKVHDHKRQASPGLLDTSNKRHCVANQSHVEYYDKMSFEDKLSGVVLKTGVNFSN